MSKIRDFSIQNIEEIETVSKMCSVYVRLGCTLVAHLTLREVTLCSKEQTPPWAQGPREAPKLAPWSKIEFDL